MMNHCNTDAVTDIITDIANRQARLCHLWYNCSIGTISLPFLLFVGTRIYYQLFTKNKNEEEDENGTDDTFSSTVQSYNDMANEWWTNHYSDSNNDHDVNMRFVYIGTYVYSIIIYLGIVYYGAGCINQVGGSDFHGIIAALLVFIQYNILCICMMYVTDQLDDNISNSTSYNVGPMGRYPVLLYITNIFWITFSIFFTLIFRHNSKHDHVVTIDVEPSDYRVHHEVLEEDAVMMITSSTQPQQPNNNNNNIQQDGVMKNLHNHTTNITSGSSSSHNRNIIQYDDKNTV